jgi:peroxiredoxin
MLMEREVVEAKTRRERKGMLRKFDPIYAILMVAVLIAVGFNIVLSRQLRTVKARPGDVTGTLAGPPQAQPGDMVPAFKTVDLQGKPSGVVYDLSKKYLLYVFSPSCEVCKHELPMWGSIAADARAKQWSVFAVSIDPLELTQAELKNQNLGFDVLIMPNMALRRAYRVVSIPQVMLVNARGVVEWVHYGALKQDDITELLTKINSGS